MNEQTNWLGRLLIGVQITDISEEDAKIVLDSVVEHIRDVINSSYNEVYISVKNEGIEPA